MPLDKHLIKKIISQALAEDAANNDITTLDFIPIGLKVEANIIAKENGIVCGISIARGVFKAFDKGIIIKEHKKDGQVIKKGDILLSLKGEARSILSSERVALNFISYLSGISTQTNTVVNKVKKAGITILDTRKTTPLLRAIEKYAVLTGGGKNHRFDLSGQYLVKDNHIAILKNTIGFEVLSWRKKNVPFEVEVESITELNKMLAYCPDIIMLDNFEPANVKRAVAILKQKFPDKNKRPLIELSGGINLENISSYAIKGVDFISLGFLTHSVKSLDLSLEITTT